VLYVIRFDSRLTLSSASHGCDRLTILQAKNIIFVNRSYP